MRRGHVGVASKASSERVEEGDSVRAKGPERFNDKGHEVDLLSPQASIILGDLAVLNDTGGGTGARLSSIKGDDLRARRDGDVNSVLRGVKTRDKEIRAIF
jgi:hypothetical protein